MKRLVRYAEDLVGKTVAYAESERTELIISFTDDTWAYMEAVYEWGDLRLDLLDGISEQYQLCMSEQLHRMEIIDAEEYARFRTIQEASNLTEAKHNAEKERLQYQELKRKYEGQGQG